MMVNDSPRSGANLRDYIPEEDAPEIAHELYDRAGRAVSVLRYWRDALERGDQKDITANSLDCLADVLERGAGLPGEMRFHFPDFEERRLGAFADAMERSSFGAPGVQAALRAVDDDTAERITDRVAELEREDEQTWRDYWRGLSPEERAEEDRMMRQHTADEIRRAEMEGGDA